MRKRILSVLLMLSLMLSLLSTSALADNLEQSDEPTLTELTVQNSDGEKVQLLNNSEEITVSLGSSYSFEATFTNVDQISEVYITSTKNGVKKFLETSYDTNKGCFVSTGLFDNDKNYIPGMIGVEYTSKISNVNVSDSVDWDTLQTALSNYCEVDIISSSEEKAEATVDLSELLNAEASVLLNVAIDVFDETTGGDLDTWLGVYSDAKKYALDGGDYFLYMDYSDPASYAMIIHDVTGNKYFKLILDDVEQTFDISGLAERVSQVNTVSGLLSDYFTIKKSADSLREEIASNYTLSTSERQQLNDEVDAYENDRKAFTMLMTSLPLIVVATGGTMVGPVLFFNAILNVVNAASNTFWDYRIGMIAGGEADDVNFVSSTHGTPLTYDFLEENNNRITSSGTYYLTGAFYEDGWGSTIKIGDSDSNIPVNVTLCLHGYTESISLASEGSTLTICDCTYEEHADGTVTGGNVSVFGSKSNQTVTMESGMAGEIQLWSENTGSVIVNGGVVNYINLNYQDGNGTVIINDGTVTTGILAYGYGSEIIINGGTVLAPVSSGQFARSHVRTDSGTITIDGGQINASVEGGTGTININDGIVGRTLENDGSTVYVKSGSVKSIENMSGAVFVNGGTIGEIENESTDGVYIYGGTIGGESRNCIVNRNGTVHIFGGVLRGECGIYDDGESNTILFINSGTNIEIDCTGQAYYNSGDAYLTPSIQAVAGYDGGVTYYYTKNNGGTTVEVSNASEIDFSKPYVRLTGSDVSDDPIPECDHEYTSVATAPTCTDQGYTTYTCNKCGDTYVTDYINASGHSYGDWVITEAATTTNPGERERVCLVCGDKIVEKIPPTGGSTGDSHGSSSSGSVTYTVSTPSNVNGGSVSVSPQNASKGTKVSITINPDKDYELDTLVITDKNGNTVKLTDEGDDKYTFIMPASRVGIEAIFKAIKETPVNPFYNVSESDYYYDAVLWAVENGVTNGTNAEGTIFTPEATVTRAQMVTFLWRAHGAPKSTGINPFMDVSASDYYYDAVLWAVANGVTNGTSATTFSPNMDVTRAQAVTFQWRAAGSPVVSSSNFDDVDTNAYYANAVTWGAANGITNGTGGNNFSPNVAVSRAQAVTFLYRELAE